MWCSLVNMEQNLSNIFPTFTTSCGIGLVLGLHKELRQFKKIRAIYGMVFLICAPWVFVGPFRVDIEQTVFCLFLLLAAKEVNLWFTYTKPIWFRRNDQETFQFLPQTEWSQMLADYWIAEQNRALSNPPKENTSCLCLRQNIFVNQNCKVCFPERKQPKYWLLPLLIKLTQGSSKRRGHIICTVTMEDQHYLTLGMFWVNLLVWLISAYFNRSLSAKVNLN